MAIFSTFIFRQFRLGKFILRYSRTKKLLSRLLNNKFKKSKKWHFCKGVNPWFWSKNGHFSNFFFFRQYRSGKYLYDILEWKNACVAYKNNKFQKSQNSHFSKGVNPWFSSKNGHFSNFLFFRQYRPGKYLYDILEQKNAVLGYKNNKFRKSKNSHFYKKVNAWFWSKNDEFLNFFFRQYRLGKCLLRYSGTKKRLSRL